MSSAVSLGNIKYSLQTTDNYKNTIAHSHQQIIEKYTLLVMEYLKFIIENTHIKNKSCFQFILIRGMETISHVFTTLLYYTKNLDVSYYNSQKALYFYVEFIGQIFDSQHSYLKLSSRDAVMYVYKKTLFELNHEKKKTSLGLTDEDKDKHKVLIVYSKLYKNIVYYLINRDEFLLKHDKDSIQSILALLEAVCEKCVACHDKITHVYHFEDAIHGFDLENSHFLQLLQLFAKKISAGSGAHKKTANPAKLLDMELAIYGLSPEMFIDWLYT